MTADKDSKEELGSLVHDSHSSIRHVIKLFSKTDRVKLGLLVVVQILLSALDLVGVLIIGVMGSLSVRGLVEQQPGNRIISLLTFLGIADLTLQRQIFILGIMAAFAFVFRTVASMFLVRKSLFFLSNRASIITANLLRISLNQSLVEVKSRSSQKFLWSLTDGVNSLMLGLVASAIGLISDVTILLVLSIGLYFVDPVVASFSLALFTGVAFILYRLQNVKARSLGEKYAKEQMFSNVKIIEVFGAFKEYSVMNRKYFAFKAIEESRNRLAVVLAEKAFMPNVSKYVFEASLIIGTLTVAALQFATQDASRAIGSLGIFIAAGTRITPAMMRVQQGVIVLKNSFGEARSTIQIIKEIRGFTGLSEEFRGFNQDHQNFAPSVSVSDIKFAYPDTKSFLLEVKSLEILSNESYAIVGPSGSGKSTLVDLILGMIQPDEGSIRISGVSPKEAISNWPGSIGYVPQEVFITQGTIKSNVCLGFNSEDIPDEYVWNSLALARLEEFVRKLPKGLETKIGDGEKGLSGGQRQRVGIARALLSNPKLLIFDEATSSLDNLKEREIISTLENLRGKITLIVIAHRYSTIENIDNIIVVDSGRIVDFGERSHVINRNQELSRYFDRN